MDETWIGRKIKILVDKPDNAGLLKGDIVTITEKSVTGKNLWVDGTYLLGIENLGKHFEFVELTKEELLEKAKKDYPIGSKVKSTYSGKEYILESQNFICNNNDEIYVDNRCFVYHDKKWAKIISKPNNTNIPPSLKFEDLKGGRYFIHCDTDQKWEKVCKICDYQDFLTVAEENTCISLERKNWDYKDYYDSQEFTEIPYKDFIKANTTISTNQKEDNLTISDLVEGEIYYCDWYNADKYNYIFEVRKNGISFKFINLKLKSFGRFGGFYSKKQTYRKATLEEKIWLEACIKADKYIPKEEALKDELTFTFDLGYSILDESNKQTSNKIEIPKVVKKEPKVDIQIKKVQKLELNLPKVQRKIIKEVKIKQVLINI
jgi:hypothetical protein